MKATSQNESLRAESNRRCERSLHDKKTPIATELRDNQGGQYEDLVGFEIKVICIYPTVETGKLAKLWLEEAFRKMSPHTSARIEFYNYSVMGKGGISWRHHINRIRPHIILMISDGRSQLIQGLRHSIKELISESSIGKKPLVIFRSLEPQPSLNTAVLLDYVSALTDKNHCELNAMNGDGSPVNCFRHPRFLLKGRTRHE